MEKINNKLDFYVDSMVFISNIVEVLNEKIDYLSKISLSDYFDKFSTTADSLDRVHKNAENFVKLHDKSLDDNNIINFINTVDNYIEYHIRLLDNSTPSNYLLNHKYIVESLGTIVSTANHKLKQIELEINKL